MSYNNKISLTSKQVKHRCIRSTFFFITRRLLRAFKNYLTIISSVLFLLRFIQIFRKRFFFYLYVLSASSDFAAILIHLFSSMRTDLTLNEFVTREP